MNGLSNFPAPPPLGQVTVHERHGELVAVPFNQADDYKLNEVSRIIKGICVFEKKVLHSCILYFCILYEVM